MAFNAIDKHYTCRYFAYGPACPNHDAFGRNICPYAHWDTGQMASHFWQPGTCLKWKSLGYCEHGTACWYEHRITGVSALYQGTIELAGFELEVADAASTAGFNTFKHEALFNLIWAVKKMIFRVGGGQVNTVSMPQHPFYPDRYRPSGIGDNTNTKRKRKAMAQKQILDSSVKPEMHTIPPLMRKRNLKSRMEDNLIDLSSSDDEIMMNTGNTSISGPKRQKISVSDLGQLTASPTTVKVNSHHSGTTPATMAARATKARDSAGIKRSNAKVVRDLPTQPTPVISTTTAAATIIKQLLLVKVKLEDSRRDMNTCQASMKALFDVHHERFDDDATMKALRNLSHSMNKVFDGGKEGAAEVDKVVAWLKGNKATTL
ncbi:hypothetical protein A1O3_03762 [Capronia epimyces CBS 606.96]|uniref:C3H1-type domain-containing protein n=1 Tax=Capronia epimyces CBS 606.96 TaxID=1182542 RepID=W9Y2S7_9EURO|nr:uncharacterized protein A1O3_03762 [Capronia epimyces CBS 606.96]EXJ86808.1 hypothetical protein A1O3_03762 [Capronia epimyces CBS 606.96]